MLKNVTTLGPKEGIDVIKAIGTPGVFSDQDRERIIDCVGETLDWEVEETKPTPPCTAIMGRAQPKKQTMDHIENYITAKLWDGMAGGAGHHDLLPSLGKLLVDLGIMFPKEKLFGHIVAILESCHRGPLPPTMQLLGFVKSAYREYRGDNRGHRKTDGYVRVAVRGIDVGPAVYPQYPSELLTSHPRLHHRAYGGETLPDHGQIPAWVDQDKLKHCMSFRLVCRKTKNSHSSPCSWVRWHSAMLRLDRCPCSPPRSQSPESTHSLAVELPSSPTTTAADPGVDGHPGTTPATEVPDEAESHVMGILSVRERPFCPATQKPPTNYYSPKKRKVTPTQHDRQRESSPLPS